MQEEQLQQLVAAAAETGGAAWQRLWRAVEPALWALVDRPRFASHLAHTEDSRRRIITAIHAQLAADHHRQLQLYLDARRISPRLSFTRWLRTIAKRIAMTYARYETPVTEVRRRSARRIPIYQ
jgi:hypothetical protein